MKTEADFWIGYVRCLSALYTYADLATGATQVQWAEKSGFFSLRFPNRSIRLRDHVQHIRQKRLSDAEQASIKINSIYLYSLLVYQ